MFLVAAWGPAGAERLPSEQMFFDPAGVDFDYYPRILLDDLSVQNSHQWEAGGDPATDADILPVLKDGYYPAGYVFSEHDYYLVPNADYEADLSDGAFTAYFYESGQYLVRITRQSGTEAVYAVFAETGLLELPGSDDKTGPSRRISGPSGDLIVVATGDGTLDQAAENIQNEGKTVQRATGVQDTIDKIKAASQAAGKKLHVELVGHGAPGMISMDDKNVDDGNLVGPDDTDIQESWIGADGKKTGHTAAVVGIAMLENGKYMLDIADDRKQGEAGGTGITPYTYDPNTGKIEDAGFESEFEYAVVECPAHPADYNLDGKVDTEDALEVLRVVAEEQETPFEGRFPRGDADRDGKLDLDDLLEMMDILIEGGVQSTVIVGG